MDDLHLETCLAEDVPGPHFQALGQRRCLPGNSKKPSRNPIGQGWAVQACRKQQHHKPARFEYPQQLCKRALVRDLGAWKGGKDTVKAGVGIGQILRVAARELRRLVCLAKVGPGAADHLPAFIQPKRAQAELV